MSKYCTLKDRPISVATTLDGREEVWGGCMLYGVWHKCENCPNVIEVGNASYSASKAEESAKKACPDDGFGGNPQHIGFYRKAFADGYEKAEKEYIELAKLWVDSGNVNIMSFERFLRLKDEESRKAKADSRAD